MSGKEFSGKAQFSDKANELSAEDLDMAVGGAAKAELTVRKDEEQKKFATKGEQRRKIADAPREEKLKHE